MDAKIKSLELNLKAKSNALDTAYISLKRLKIAKDNKSDPLMRIAVEGALRALDALDCSDPDVAELVAARERVLARTADYIRDFFASPPLDSHGLGASRQTLFRAKDEYDAVHRKIYGTV